MLKKISLFFLIIFSLTAIAQDETIKVGISYNETSARIEAFKDVENKISKNIYIDYLTDPNYKENIEKINNKIFRIEDIDKERYLCPFYLKDILFSYSITYDNNINYSFYYNVLGGMLLKFDIVEQKNFPRKVLSYSRYGNLISVTFEVSSDEQYIYSANGKLLAHWIGNDMMNKDSSIPKFLKIKRGDF